MSTEWIHVGATLYSVYIVNISCTGTYLDQLSIFTNVRLLFEYEFIFQNRTINGNIYASNLCPLDKRIYRLTLTPSPQSRGRSDDYFVRGRLIAYDSHTTDCSCWLIGRRGCIVTGRFPPLVPITKVALLLQWITCCRHRIGNTWIRICSAIP